MRKDFAQEKMKFKSQIHFKSGSTQMKFTNITRLLLQITGTLFKIQQLNFARYVEY